MSDVQDTQPKVPARLAKLLAATVVRTADGHPLRVFHGTNGAFVRYRTAPVHTLDKRRLGAYFTASERFARCYGAVVREVYLDIRRPLDLRGKAAADVIAELPVSDRAKAELCSAFKGLDYCHYGLLEALPQVSLRKALEDSGYDGVIYTEGHADAYIAFEARQIIPVPKRKSALEVDLST
ncbi:hypothetical protein HNP46_000043 [Pseudomonas nitritireducens]|uniref:ART-PolyVal-like domain-containing protein n=1 Tax=Pseudomonas nitroreducens TaxID=46680 RepID=A0A7W7NZH7_PSENT|nr:hypothetical protein [Pseudomonas nitritireducens]MBB4861232.1 hypothetical protein [Pseudomonas nitritireducens]